MTGSLQISKGYYYAVLNTRDKNGKRVPKWIPTHLKAEKGNKRKAQAILTELKLTYSDCEYVEPTKWLFCDYLRDWLEIHKADIQQSTYDGYKHMFTKHIYPYFKALNVKLIKLKPYDIQKYYADCQSEKGLSPNTVRKHHQLIHKCLESAVANKYIKENVSNFVEKPKTTHTEQEFLEVSEIKKLLNVVKNEKIEVAVIFAVYFGLRRSEVLGLTWDAVDFEKRQIKIKRKVIRTKNKNGKMDVCISDNLKTKSSYGIYPLNETVYQMLLKQKERIKENELFFGSEYSQRDKAFICVDERGNLLKPDYISGRFATLADRHGFDVTFHGLRHSCGSMLLYLGFNMKEVQEWLRHASYQTTANIYSHTYKNLKEDITDRLCKAL